MMTALLAARNILGMGKFDTWKVNTDAEYHEGDADGEQSESGTSGAAARQRGVTAAASRGRSRRSFQVP